MALSLLASACSSSGLLGSALRTSPTGAPNVTTVAVSGSISLTAEQSAAVRAHFAGDVRGRGNGRGRNGGLPPGIAQNLERGKPLPTGIAKRYLPGDLLTRLPRLDDGLEYVVAAGKLLLVEAATHIVRDVLIDVIYS